MLGEAAQCPALSPGDEYHCFKNKGEDEKIVNDLVKNKRKLKLC